MDKKLDKKQLGVLTAAGLAVATVCAGAAIALSGTSSEQPKRDTVPVGQLVEVPASSTPAGAVEPDAVVADPSPKDTAVPNQPAQQPAPQNAQPPAPAPADEPTNTPPPTTMPTGENGAPLNPPPPPSAPPVGNPNGVPNPPAPTPTT